MWYVQLVIYWLDLFFNRWKENVFFFNKFLFKILYLLDNIAISINKHTLVLHESNQPSTTFNNSAFSSSPSPHPFSPQNSLAPSYRRQILYAHEESFSIWAVIQSKVYPSNPNLLVAESTTDFNSSQQTQSHKNIDKSEEIS